MSDKSIILQPKYVADFQCDGSKCNAKCCGNKWRIRIDADTYKKYQRIKNPVMRKKILSSIKPSTNKIGFEINFGEGKSCPLLCEDNLCYIQRNLGGTFYLIPVRGILELRKTLENISSDF